MVTKRLELIFQNAAGRRSTLTVHDPREDLTSVEVMTAMELIISRNIFTSPGGDLSTVAAARIITREVEDVVVI